MEDHTFFSIAGGRKDGGAVNWKYFEQASTADDVARALATAKEYPCYELALVQKKGKRVRKTLLDGRIM